MTLWGVASCSGAPGATTVALALTRAFPGLEGRPRLLVEADPSGGVLAARFERDLRLDVDLSHLTVALKHEWDRDSVLACGRELWPGVHVVVGPPAGSRARAALAVRPDQVAACLAGADADVIADLGRLDVSSPALALARRCVEVVFVGRSRVEDALSLRAVIEELADVRVAASLLLVRDRDRSGRNPSPLEVADMVGVPLVGVLPVDRRSASVFSGGAGGGRRLEKSAWWGTVRAVASLVASHAPVPAVENATGSAAREGPPDGPPVMAGAGDAGGVEGLGAIVRRSVGSEMFDADAGPAGGALGSWSGGGLTAAYGVEEGWQ
jgi:hypothetical protein